ncbi:MAG: NAD(+)/NADH kinase [Lachnospiraceae bacterium]|nr:NAD(+)/NADH kinase [Lachnospiraceae bacterium]
MNIIGIIMNNQIENAEPVAEEIRAYLANRGRSCYVSETGEDLPISCECALVLGGDGTLLRAAKVVLDRQLPLFGINLGTLGYLAEIGTEDIIPSLDRILDGEFSIEKRMMLSGTIIRDGKPVLSDTALNEISLSRLKQLRAYCIKNYVNGVLLSTYSADGMIISTATGSTGYNLSVGGPIVSPEAELIVMTPHAAHSLISRSIVLPGSDEVCVEIGEGRSGFTEEVVSAWFDGDNRMNLSTGDCIAIRKEKRYTNIIKISHLSFVEILRRKMSQA